MRVAQFALHDITKRFAGHVVLDRVDFTVRPGERIGIVGDNGSGKSTLLRLIAGRDTPDNGAVTVVAPGGVGYLPQSLELPENAVVQDAVDLALSDLRELEARMHRAEAELAAQAGEGRSDEELAGLFEEYAELLEQHAVRGGHEADTRVDIALHHLGLPGLERDRPLATLSGGERSRLALAGTLASAPELLLLDEPTNDLDEHAVIWLEEHLRRHRGTVVAVTHDRVFLERLTTTVLEVDSGRVTRYGNGYEGYLSAKAAERRRRLREYEQWRAELERNRELVSTHVSRMDGIPRKLPLANFGAGQFRARGRVHGATSRIRNAKERVARLTENAVARPADPLAFTAVLSTTTDRPAAETAPEAVTETAAETVAELADVRVDGRLRVGSLRIGRGERLLVTGPNGAGKTTLLRVLAGELAADGGSVTVTGRVGHLRQDPTPWPSAMTVPQAFAQGRGGHPDEHVEELLSLGLFGPDDLRRRVGELSYGQRRRIELARLVSDPVDLLLLDEPTNHLSPALVEELEQALTGYRGAVVVVTHDRRMRQRFAGSRLRLDAGRVAAFATRYPGPAGGGPARVR
ncbi:MULTISPECIES: TlrC/CarA/OleB/SrmB family ABC-F type ribosomal protection protein [Streptomyces]|uniref:TlrC/CarA/OleB/SrmB family ABC-F type ribosomal protection protein n=1 Tax=Streptomyces TaxID=1883 RepID=UPI0016726E70|nr:MULTISPECIES: TlrC/CarA/OleB/SrmB family ABC-F type ribosomal protection protein [Streptomyces]MBK3522465.1 TlrC/CarA/OleB/SrmB family ABC-F type ribosomal protection protein [Streptomyces sp. MBT70]GGR85969.1 ABC transporter ATP-binding protein [Streptomyces eurythermus]